MPRYDYKCRANGHVFELVQGFNDEAAATCPEDGSQADRQLSIPAVHYKGSGFYTTDSRASNSASAAVNGKSADKDSADGKSEKSDKSEKKKSDSSSAKSSSSGGHSHGTGPGQHTH